MDEMIGFSIKELFQEISRDVKDLRNHVDLQDTQRNDRVENLAREVLALKLNTANAAAMQDQVAKNARANFRLGVSLIIALLGNIAYLATQFWPHK